MVTVAGLVLSEMWNASGHYTVNVCLCVCVYVCVKRACGVVIVLLLHNP